MTVPLFANLTDDRAKYVEEKTRHLDSLAEQITILAEMTHRSAAEIAQQIDKIREQLPERPDADK